MIRITDTKFAGGNWECSSCKGKPIMTLLIKKKWGKDMNSLHLVDLCGRCSGVVINKINTRLIEHSS